MSRLRGICVPALLLVLLPASGALASPAPGFIENLGQVDSQVSYYAMGSRASVYFTADAITLDLRQAERGCALRVRFEGANPAPRVEARGEMPGRYNYFRGQNPAKWRAGARAYGELVYHQLWPGVDLVFRLEAGGVSYEAVLAPGADARQVRFSYEGADRVETLDGGVDRIETAVGVLESTRPSGDGRGGMIRAASAGREPPPVIADNPAALVWSTFLGGSGNDQVQEHILALDVSGNAVVTGYTTSSDFPTTPGAYDTSYHGLPWTDIFVAKISSTGDALLWSTFVGGSGAEFPEVIALDSSGDPVILGYTTSSDFPTTPGAYDQSYNGSGDVFVTKLSSSGSNLLWSTYLGGGGMDDGGGMALDSSGNVVITGSTASFAFPTTPGAYDRSYNGGSSDAFVAKLSSTGSSLLWSTFLGGHGQDPGKDLSLDSSGNPVVTGLTTSANFPTTSGAYQVSLAGASDVFVTKLASDGSALLWSTYVGGTISEDSWGLALDAYGNAVIMGETNSPDYPTTPGAYDRLFNGGADIFVTKLASGGNTLLWSTYLGGSDYDYGLGLALDSSANVVIVGDTGSSDFPTTPGAYDASYNGGGDALAAKLSSAGDALLWSSFLGGSGAEQCHGLALDSSGNAVVAGWTTSSDFPTTPGAFDGTWDGGDDVFVAKVNMQTPTSVARSGSPAPAALAAVPNPASSQVRFRITGATGPVAARIYDTSGRLVRSLAAPEWDCRDEAGRGVGAGLYFYVARVQGRTISGKLVIAR